MSEFEMTILSIMFGWMIGILLIGLWILVTDVIPLQIYMWRHRKDKSTHPIFYQQNLSEKLQPTMLENITKELFKERDTK